MNEAALQDTTEEVHETMHVVPNRTDRRKIMSGKGRQGMPGSSLTRQYHKKALRK